MIGARHRQIMSIAGKLPDLPSDCFIAPNATVIGDVDVFDCASIWYGAVVRGRTVMIIAIDDFFAGDRNRIKIGAFTNVQDRSVIITVDMLESGIPATTEIGDHVTIGMFHYFFRFTQNQVMVLFLHPAKLATSV